MNIKEFLIKYDLSKGYCEIKKYTVLKDFSEFIFKETVSELNLSLFPFTTQTPFLYHHKNKILPFLNFLINNREKVIENFEKNADKISHAVSSLLRKGTSWEFEKSIHVDQPDGIEKLDGIYHSEYIRYCEHIYNVFIGIPLDVLGIKNDYTTINSNNLKNTEIGNLTDGFNNIVRNAIAHGNISYSNNLTTYSTFNKKERLLSSDFLDLFDNMVYNCNTMLISYLLFLCNWNNSVNFNNLPVGFKFLFIKGFCEQMDFEILSAIDTNFIDGKQINIRCKTTITNRLWHNFLALRIANYILSDLNCAIYTRCSVSIDFSREIPALYIIDFNKLKIAIEENHSFERIPELYEQVLNNWYDLKLNKWQPYYIRQFFKLTLKVGKLNRNEDLKRKGQPLLEQRFLIREKDVIDSGKYRTIKIKAVLNEHNLSDKILIQIANLIITKNKKDYTPRRDFISRKVIRRKPGRIILYLFKYNYRIRSLNSLSVKDNFILQAEYTTKGFPYRSGVAPDLEVNNIRIRFGSLV